MEETTVSLAGDADWIIGVDTHLDTHTAALCDGRGRAVAQLQVPATTAGYAQLLAWAGSAVGEGRAVWAVEGTRHYGLGLARYLASAGEQVSEIDASRHLSKRRAGKSDAIDAVRAARELLARPHPAQMRADGDREALRLLMIDWDNAIASAKTARAALAAVLVTAPAPLRERLRCLPRGRRAKECAALTCPMDADRQTRVLHQTLIRLGQRIATLAGVAAELEAQITQLVEEMAPGLVAAEDGLGALSAAQLLLSWSHAGRIRSEAAFTMLSGTAPVPVSSGRTDRHRLNRLGDRQLNRALHVIAVNRMRFHPPRPTPGGA
jgi:transposase